MASLKPSTITCASWHGVEPGMVVSVCGLRTAKYWPPMYKVLAVPTNTTMIVRPLTLGERMHGWFAGLWYWVKTPFRRLRWWWAERMEDRDDARAEVRDSWP